MLFNFKIIFRNKVHKVTEERFSDLGRIMALKFLNLIICGEALLFVYLGFPLFIVKVLSFLESDKRGILFRPKRHPFSLALRFTPSALQVPHCLKKKSCTCGSVTLGFNIQKSSPFPSFWLYYQIHRQR